MWSSVSVTPRPTPQAELGEVVAQLGERLLLQEAGEVPGPLLITSGLPTLTRKGVELVGHRLQRHRLPAGPRSGPGARQLAALAAERAPGLRQRGQQRVIGRGVEQAGDQRVVLGARAILLRPGRLGLMEMAGVLALIPETFIQ